MKRKHLQSTPETGAFGIQTVYRNAGPWVKAGFLRQVFYGICGVWRLPSEGLQFLFRFC